MLRATNIQNGRLDADELVYVPEDFVSDRQRLRSGDQVIASSSGSKSVVGKAAPVNDKIVGFSFGAFCSVARPLASDLDGWLRTYFQTTGYRQFVEETAMGNNINNLRSSDLLKVQIALPPLPEQRRIVAKVDGLTARTARARKELDRIPTLIARYKQRLLALAFSGELTAGWRSEHDLLPPVPTSIDDLGEGLRYGTAQKCYEEPNGIAVLRIPNVSSGRISLDDLKYAELDPKELAKLVLKEGDLLIVRSNGSADLVGRPALVTGEAVGLAYAGYLIRIRPKQDLVLPKFLTFMLEAPEIRGIIEKGARSTSGVHNVNAKELGALQIPLFGLLEQAEVVRRIESAFGWLDRMSADHAAAARLLPKLDAAILAKAFRGELVPQDPNDEPASVLLERISVEREVAPKKTRGRQPKVTNIRGEASIKFTATGTLTDAPKKSGARSMTKSRQDDDVMGKPYLAGKLKALRSGSVQVLFKAADLPVADFYKQLAWEIDKGHILDDPEQLKAA